MKLTGLILCGGYGKRMWPLTENIPKPLVELKPKYSLIDRQLFDFVNLGVEKVILLTGYLSEKIQEKVGGEFHGVEIDYVVEEEPKGTLFAIKNGMKKAGTDVMIQNGDVVSDINLKKFVSAHYHNECQATMFVTNMRSQYGVVELDGDRVRSFKEKPMLDQYINGGIYLFSADIFENGFGEGDVERTLFPSIAKAGGLGYYKENCFWGSVDTLKDLEEMRKEFANREDKPWGYEKVLVRTEKYMTKELYIKENESTSLHYHKEKDETLHIQSGSLAVEFDGGDKKIFQKNSTFRITPNMIHRLIALENTLLQEVSTPQLDDTIRVKDYYRLR